MYSTHRNGNMKASVHLTSKIEDDIIRQSDVFSLPDINNTRRNVKCKRNVSNMKTLKEVRENMSDQELKANDIALY